MMSDRPSSLLAAIAVTLTLFGVSAMRGVWAEEVAPVSMPGAKSDPAPEVDKHVNDKIDQGRVGEKDEHAGANDAAKDGANINSGSGSGVGGGDNGASAAPNGTAWGPIDTEIKVLGKPRFGHRLKVGAQRKSRIARSAGILRNSYLIRARFGAHRILRNAIGQPVRRTIAAREAERRLAKVDSESHRGQTDAPDSAGAEAWREGFVPLRSGPLQQRALPVSMAMIHATINGRYMIRSAAGTGAVGGPTKNNTGVISGSNFQIRHP